MPLSVFSPLLYLLIGFVIGKTGLEIKGIASAFLTKGVIPLVIIYNIVTYRPGLLAVVLGVMAIMAVMSIVGRLTVRDPIRNLCFFYLNIGWLGLPVATALFGDGAASLFVAAYIGSTIFGNSIGASMLEHGAGFKERLVNLAKSPPVISVLIGIVLLPAGDAIAYYLHSVYDVAKFLLGLIGMAILGIWLSESKIRLVDIRNEIFPSLYRGATLFILMSVFLLICHVLDVALVTQNMPALYLICLLPPAANIIVLETHYLKTGASAKMIAAGTCISIAAIGLYIVALHHF